MTVTTKTIQQLTDISYEMRLRETGIITLKTRRLRGDQIEVFQILNGYENRNVLFLVLDAYVLYALCFLHGTCCEWFEETSRRVTYYSGPWRVLPGAGGRPAQRGQTSVKINIMSAARQLEGVGRR